MPYIPTLAEIRETIREEQSAFAEELARRVREAAAEAQPGIFNREHMPHRTAALYLGISDKQLKKLRQKGLVTPTHRDGIVAYYARADLDAYASGTRGSLNAGGRQ